MQKRKREEKEENKGPLKRHFSAGGAVYRTISGKTEWLLIRPARTSRWQLPKGTIDEGETSDITAVREVFEETGVQALITQKIDTVRYFFAQKGERVFKSVVFYLMESKGEEPKIEEKWAHEVDEAVWLDYNEGYSRLTYKGEKEILKKAQDLLGKVVRVV